MFPKFSRAENICCGNKFCSSKTKNIFGTLLLPTMKTRREELLIALYDCLGDSRAHEAQTK